MNKELNDFINMIEKEWTFFEDDLPQFEKGDVFIRKEDWNKLKQDAKRRNSE